MSGELVYIFSQDTNLEFEQTKFNSVSTELSIGMVFNPQEDQVGILILEASTKGIKEGDAVYGTDMLPQ